MTHVDPLSALMTRYAAWTCCWTVVIAMLHSWQKYIGGAGGVSWSANYFPHDMCSGVVPPCHEMKAVHVSGQGAVLARQATCSPTSVTRDG